jgi:hypothetical protein
VFINIARLLWGFNIGHARDERGEIIPVDFTSDGLMPGAMSNAKMFQCCIPTAQVESTRFIVFGIGGDTDWVAITPRSAKREKIMRDEWIQAEKTGVDFTNIRFEVV